MQQFFQRKTKAPNRCVNSGPFLGEKLFAFALEQQIAGARFDEHPQTSLFLDQLFVDQLLIGPEDGKRIDPVFGGDTTHRGQRLTFLENAVEYHMNATVAELTIDWLCII